jgi:tetratricopeptide (TPR) repeat protein/tRNA A-37 threonylcarbamoyl transferase component Bud32
MSPQRWQQVQAVFNAVLQHEPSKRGNILDELCGDDVALRAEVAKLLAHDEQAEREGFLGLQGSTIEPISPSTPPTLPLSKPQPGKLTVGTQVAGYEILGILGSGGMGIVYKARQLQLNRLVALKMIRQGTHADEQRFLVEAQAVAKMQHPHIVQVYEIGEIDGDPFFSLEFCNAGSLNEKLKGVPLPPHEAAALTQQLAEAIHSAHERGILHRDLKPANVLLVGDEEMPVSQCVPKIADFGLAKKLGDDSSTRTGTVLGTPSYMPPEQVRGQTELKATVDVYSLGALFYELLVGRPPFRASTPTETMHQVLTEEPVPPRRLQSKTPRDLETICLKCLQKNPDRRYATAKALADDLRRFLAGEPIQARPVGRIEKTIKWVKRRPTVTALAGFLVLAVIAGFTGIAWQWRDAVAERNRAESEATKALTAQNRAELEAEKLKASLDMLADPFDEPFGIDGALFRVPKEVGERRQLVALLKHAKERVNRRNLPPEVQAAVLVTTGDAYRNLGLYEEAEPCLLTALSLFPERKGGEQLDRAACLHALGHFYHQRGRVEKGDYQKALDYYGAALEIRKQQPYSIKAFCETTFFLGWLYLELEDYPQAKKCFAEVIGLYESHEWNKDRLVILAHNGLIAADLEKVRDEGSAHYQQLVARLRGGVAQMLAVEGDADWNEVFLEGEKAFAALATREGDKWFVVAVGAFRKCDEIIRERKGPDHYYRTIPLFLLANMLEKTNDPKEAESAYQECLKVVERSVGLEHWEASTIVRAYATFLHKQGKTKDALVWFDRLLEATETRFGKGHFLTANAKVTYADFLAEIQNYSGAQQQCQAALDIYKMNRGEQHRKYASCKALLEDATNHNKQEANP